MQFKSTIHKQHKQNSVEASFWADLLMLEQKSFMDIYALHLQLVEMASKLPHTKFSILVKEDKSQITISRAGECVPLFILTPKQ